MIATDHTTLRLSGALNVEHLTVLELRIGVNAHGWAIVEGEAGEDALEQLTGAVAGREQHILTIDESGMEKCLFAGVIREASLISVDGYSRFHVELLSGTCLMDREIRSRSFQDVGRTYSQVAEQVCSEYNGGAAICTVGENKTLGRPVIQYRETDWEFLMRMASHCGGVLVPETHRGLPRLWFGFPDRSFTCEFPEDSYTSGISQRYYELGGMAAGYDRADFFYYDVKSTQLCDLGWYAVFKGQSFIISEKYAVLERGELIFTYRLGRPGLGWGKMLYNEKISGMTLLGEVLETARETVKLKLDIDQDWNPGGPYPYTWRPETGNFMYCMPQVGTRISLYCPNYDEKEAIAVNCVRTNGASCGRMSDPAKRSFVTEHGKEMNLYPEEMSLLGGSEGTVHLSDENGITISSQKPIFILGMSIRFEAPTFKITVPNSELLMAKYQFENKTPDSCYQMSNLFNILAMNHTHMEGWNRVTYRAFQDAPVEGDFWGSLIGNVLAGLAVVAMVAVAVASLGFGAPVIIGAIAVGSMAVIGQGISDYMSGSVSSTEVYMKTGFLGAVAGAVSGGVGSMIEGAIPEGWALLAKMGVVGSSGVLETWIENTIQGQETTLFDAGLAFVMSAGFYGLGDNLARAFKKWKNATGQTDDIARAIAGQTDNVLDNMAGQVDNILDDVASQMDNLTSDVAKQTDDLLSDVAKRADNLVDDAALATVKQADDLLNDIAKRADNLVDDAALAIVKQADNTLDNVAGQVDNILEDVASHGDNVVADIASRADDVAGDLASHTDDIARTMDDVADQADDVLDAIPNAGKQVQTVPYGDQFDRVGRKKVLKPNVEYVDPNNYRYVTDAQGRISSVEGTLQLGTGQRNAYAQRTVGGADRLPTDDGGHLIASQFNGSGQIDNLVPQSSALNRAKGDWYKMEQEWAACLKAGQTVDVSISLVYAGGSARPTDFIVEYVIDNGETILKLFPNK